MVSIPRLPTFHGEPLVSDGSQASFLTGATWIGLASLILLPLAFGDVLVSTSFNPGVLQSHEMLFGYLAAIVAGFTFTSTRKWSCHWLGFLALVWLAGRLAIAVSAPIGGVLAGAVDSLFLVLVAATATRASIAGRDWKALAPAALLFLFFIGNLFFHIGAYHNGSPEFGKRIGIAAVVMLVTLVAGRAMAGFGREADIEAPPPATLRTIDVVALAVSGVALAIWILLPDYKFTTPFLLLAAVVHAIRLSRWVGDGTAQTSLTLVQQIAYGFLPLGFLLLASDAFFGRDSTDIRAWAVSATGILALAIVGRLRFEESRLRAPVRPIAKLIYAAAAVVVVARVIASFVPHWAVFFLPLGGTALIVVFALFCIAFAPLLAVPRATPEHAATSPA
jgi:uncharacterized protein involved in response to NO